MKKTLLILALALTQTLTFAQAPALQWQKCLGGTSYDYINSIQPTPDGGYIVAGDTYSNNRDVTGNHGYDDAWVAKLSSTGSLQWQKALGGTGDDYSSSIQPTTDGGYILAGYTYSSDGDVTGNHGIDDAWVVKLNSNGSLQWQKALGGTSYDYALSIQLTPDGGYIVAGSTQSTDGDVIGNHGAGDAWVVKLSTTGDLEWQKVFGGTGNDYAYSIQPTTDGGYIVAGSTGSTDGDVTGNHGTLDAWVVKLSSTGSLQWQKVFGGTGTDVANSILLTPDGGYIVAGYTDSTGGDVTGNHGGQDAWVVKLTAKGAIEWQKALGGTSEDIVYSIQLTPDGGYILAGSAYSTDGDVTGNHGEVDAWVVKLDATGAIEWQKALGGTSNDFSNSIQLTPDGGYILAGATYSIDGYVIGNHGGSDAWVVKLDPELSTTTFATQELKLYPNPAKSILQLQTATNASLDKITITDLTGKVIITQTTNTAQINIEPLASGMYILEATSGEAKYCSKFVKE